MAVPFPGRPFVEVKTPLLPLYGQLGAYRDGINLFLQLFVRFDAVALLQGFEDFCEQYQAGGRFLLQLSFIVAFCKVIEVALLEVLVLAAAGECKLEQSGCIASLRHAGDNSANVVRVCCQYFQITALQFLDTLGGIAGGREVLIESVCEQCIQAEAVMAAGAENELAFDGPGVVLFALMDSEGKRQFGLGCEDFIVFATVDEMDQIRHINTPPRKSTSPIGPATEKATSTRGSGF